MAVAALAQPVDAARLLVDLDDSECGRLASVESALLAVQRGDRVIEAHVLLADEPHEAMPLLVRNLAVLAARYLLTNHFLVHVQTLLRFLLDRDLLLLKAAEHIG